jgi:putative ABC transport system substrate-binding protein
MPALRRREFITLIGGAAVAWPAVARVERAPLPVIGYLSPRTAEDSGEVLAEFRRGLGETGFVEGHNVAIEYRWLAGRYNLLPEFIGAATGLRDCDTEWLLIGTCGQSSYADNSDCLQHRK